MKTLFAAVLLPLLSFLPECVHDSGQRISDGIYREPANIEAIIVKGQHMTLQLMVSKGPRLGLVSGTYRYEILTDRELRFGASSNDAFFVETVLNYDWLWDGKDIVRKSKETSQTVVYSRE